MAGYSILDSMRLDEPSSIACGGTGRERGGFGVSLGPAQRIDITGHATSAFIKSVENGIECG
jgi:hypothetical protein